MKRTYLCDDSTAQETALDSGLLIRPEFLIFPTENRTSAEKFGSDGRTDGRKPKPKIHSSDENCSSAENFSSAENCSSDEKVRHLG